MASGLRVLGVFALMVTSSSVAAGEDLLPPVDMTPVQVSQHAWYVAGTGEGVVVFDTLGTPALGVKLLAAIRTVTSEPVKRVYISHYHADHMYGNQAFSASGAEIIASDGAKRYLEGGVAQQRLSERRVSLAPWVDDSTRIVNPDRFVQGEERFTLGEVDIRVVDLGSAHSEGDLVLFVENDGVLFSGDIIFQDRIPFLGSSSSAEWLAILNEMEQAEVSVIVPGHGRAAESPNEIVSLTRNYLAYVRLSMQQAVSDWIPFDEAYEATDWGDFIEYPAFLEANRRNAYGVYLSLEQESLNSR
jgi:glyoxylase-like metal-dependent hydrolase (beta-lactamase superfamily II)